MLKQNTCMAQLDHNKTVCYFHASYQNRNNGRTQCTKLPLLRDPGEATTTKRKQIILNYC